MVAKKQGSGPYGFGFIAGPKDPETGEFPKTGMIYMTRCYKCGSENYLPLVSSGQCAWCGYDANADEALKEEFANLDGLLRSTGYRREIK